MTMTILTRIRPVIIMPPGMATTGAPVEEATTLIMVATIAKVPEEKVAFSPAFFCCLFWKLNGKSRSVMQDASAFSFGDDNVCSR